MNLYIFYTKRSKVLTKWKQWPRPKRRLCYYFTKTSVSEVFKFFTLFFNSEVTGLNNKQWFQTRQGGSVKTGDADLPWHWLWSWCCCCCCQGWNWHLHELYLKARGGTRGHHAESFHETETHIWPQCSVGWRNITINLSFQVISNKLWLLHL